MIYPETEWIKAVDLTRLRSVELDIGHLPKFGPCLNTPFTNFGKLWAPENLLVPVLLTFEVERV